MANDVTIHVKAEDHASRDMDRIGNKVTAAAKRSFLKSGGHAGGAFAAGFIKTVTLGMVGSGFAQAGMKLAPQAAHLGAALGVTAGAALAVKLASALSAALPLALGAGALAGPLIFLWKTQEKAVDRLKKKAKDFMTEISKPVKAPFLESLKLVGNALDEWGPKFSKAIKPLAKELPGFAKGALKGIENFFAAVGEKMPSITKGFKEWGRQLPGIGTALGDMVAAWIEDGPALVEGIQDTADSMKDLSNAVGSVGKGFRKFNQINQSFVELRDQVTLSAQTLRIKMLSALRTVFSALGKFSPTYRRIAGEIGEMLGKARAEAKKTADQINRRKIEPKIRADINDLQAKVKAAKKRLQETNDKKTQAKIKAEISDLQGKVARAKALLAHLRGKTVTITAHMAGFAAVKSRISYLRSANQSYGARASGGFVGGQHAAEGGPRGGQVLVGEQGPEIVDLPMGSHVNSNPDSVAKMGKGRGGNITINVHAPNYVGAPSDLLRALVDAKRRGQLDVILR